MRFLAHRGAPKLAPENTLPSFARALSLGMREFELDVHLTSDGRLVVHHDFTLSHTAQTPVVIKEMDFDSLSRLNVGAYFPGAEPVRIPLLSEVMALLGASVSTLNVEVKNEGGTYPGIERRLLDEVNSTGGWEGRILYSSFDHEVLRTIRSLSPDARLGVLVGKVKIDGALDTAASLGAESVHISVRQAGDDSILSAIKNRGFRTLVYTVNDRDAALSLEKRGVDGVFTDDPSVAFPGARI